MAAGLAILLARPGWAHPDIVLYCQVLLSFDGPVVDAIGQRWTFDEGFSRDLLADFDGDGDGSFSAAESALVEQDVMASLAEVRYLTYVRVDGQDAGPLEPYAFQASVRGGIVEFLFGMALPTPVDPATATITLQIKDPDFLIGVLFDEADPVALRGADGRDCSVALAENEADAYFGGTVVPQEITLRCAP